MGVRFTKMQALGNDYVYLNCMEHTPRDLSALAVRISDRHFGVGSDGLICICPSERADVGMRIFNADGSEGEMCGNGIRCVGKLVYEKGLVRRPVLTVETLAGIKELRLVVTGGRVREVEVDMGPPGLSGPKTVEVLGRPYTVWPVSMGNPHVVAFVESVKELNLTGLGPGLEWHPELGGRTNAEFVQAEDAGRLRMRVWERGSGETLACGTGACAAAVAARLAGLAGGAVTVALPGGELQIRWDGGEGHVYMTGPAVTVFEGEFDSLS